MKFNSISQNSMLPSGEKSKHGVSVVVEQVTAMVDHSSNWIRKYIVLLIVLVVFNIPKRNTSKLKLSFPGEPA